MHVRACGPAAQWCDRVGPVVAPQERGVCISPLCIDRRYGYVRFQADALRANHHVCVCAFAPPIHHVYVCSSADKAGWRLHAVPRGHLYWMHGLTVLVAFQGQPRPKWQTGQVPAISQGTGFPTPITVRTGATSPDTCSGLPSACLHTRMQRGTTGRITCNYNFAFRVAR